MSKTGSLALTTVLLMACGQGSSLTGTITLHQFMGTQQSVGKECWATAER
jgi:hypothetical protein